ncbi:MAG: hypothetical protein ABIC68_00580 [Candidatus Omnitrophota bacterium]
MNKRLVLLFCALFVFAAAMPAFASVQNIKVSGDVIGRYIARTDFDLSKDTAGTDDKIRVFNTVMRLRVDADLTDNVSAVVRLINERNWDEATVSSTNIDLDLAYVTFKEFFYDALTVTAGRQELHFGNDMIIGDGVGNPVAAAVSGAIGTNQTTNYTEATGYGAVNGDLAYRKAFDSIRATLNYDPLVIDVVFARLRDNVITGGATNDDLDLWGADATYQFSDKWDTLLEGYAWAKIDKGQNTTGTKGKTDSTYTYGVRVSTNPMDKVNIQQEFAYQAGEKYIAAASSRNRQAFASQTCAMITPGWKYEPVFGLVYSYFSGDANRAGTDADKDYRAWDPMFENQTNGSIINALFPQSNCHNIDVSARFTPIEDLTVKAEYVYLMLAKESAASGVLNMNDYDGAGYAYEANKKPLAQEVDVTLVYDYTEDVQLGLLAGWLWPGKAIAKTSSGVKQRQTASEAIATVKVAF